MAWAGRTPVNSGGGSGAAAGLRRAQEVQLRLGLATGVWQYPPVHPGDIPTPKGADGHPQPALEGQGPGPSRHRGPEAGGHPGPPGQPFPGIGSP